jgi:hypothetical protein
MWGGPQAPLLLGSPWSRVTSGPAPRIESSPGIVGHMSAIDPIPIGHWGSSATGHMAAQTQSQEGGGGAGPSMVVLGLVLVKRATPVVVDLVLALGLSRYLRVLVPHGTDSAPPPDPTAGDAGTWK